MKRCSKKNGAAGIRTQGIAIITYSREIKVREIGEVVSGRRSSVAEHWWLNPESLGSTALLFFLSLCCFKGLLDSNVPDYVSLYYLYQSTGVEEPHPSDSPCCDNAQILSNS